MHKIKRSHLYITILLVVILETTLLRRMRLFGVQPDLLLASVLFFSLYLKDNRTALEAGLVAGILRDLLSAGFFGINIILFGAAAILTSINADKIYKEFFLTQMFFTGVSAMLLYSAYFFMQFIMGNRANAFGEGLIWVIIPAAVYTAAAAPALFFALGRTFRVSSA